MQITLDPTQAEYVKNRVEVLDQVRRLLLMSIDLQCSAEQIDPDTALFGTGLGLDSLDAAEVIIALEVDLGLKLDGQEQQIVALRSVNALVDLILRERGQLP